MGCRRKAANARTEPPIEPLGPELLTFQAVGRLSGSRPVYGQQLKSTRLQWLFTADKKVFLDPVKCRGSRLGARTGELGRFCQSFESAAEKLFLQVDW